MRFELEDETGQITVSIDSELYDEYKDSIKDNRLLIVSGRWDGSEEPSQQKLKANKLLSWRRLRSMPVVNVILELDAESNNKMIIEKVKELLANQSGGRQNVYVEYRSAENNTLRYRLDKNWQVEITDQLLDDLKCILGEQGVRVDYSSTT